MPLGLAFVAGGLATVNPCGFSLLPAMLSFYIGGAGDRRPGTVFSALKIGGAVAVGVMGVFLVVVVPITLGASQIVRAVPWAGILTGVALVVAGVATLAGRHVSVSLRAPASPGGDDGAVRRMLAFGVAYGIASLGCTLPIFLSVIGASLASRGSAAALAMIAFYALGMLAMVMALSLAAGFAREGLASRMKSLIPRMHRISGALLTAAGIYLTYYWGRVLWGPVDTLARDPIVGPVQRIAATLERLAAGRGGWIVGVATALVIGALVVVAVRRGATKRAATNDLG